MARNDVLIIGAGPSGLFAAAELARHGVGARLVEQEVRPHHEARHGDPAWHTRDPGFRRPAAAVPRGR
jgi:2-polyprenyl-6-methoxyphenol hydroxylase-like FAD-dependent oxidoreductase